MSFVGGFLQVFPQRKTAEPRVLDEDSTVCSSRSGFSWSNLSLSTLMILGFLALSLSHSTHLLSVFCHMAISQNSSGLQVFCTFLSMYTPVITANSHSC